MQHQVEEARGHGGVALFRQVWLPDGEVRALAVLAHGLAEHSGRYRELVERLLARGTAVYAQDHRGHGRSGGGRCYVAAFAWVVEDLVAWLRSARSRHAGRPLCLIGHSFGGTVALAAALDQPELVDRLVLSAPALGRDPDVPRLRLAFGRALSVLAPRTGLLRLDATAISRDPAVVADYERDALNFRGAIPARTLVELLAAMGELARRLSALRPPTLVLHGTADRLVPLAFNAPLYTRLGPADLTIREYAGFYHEILHEPERARVYADLESWLAARA
jgi:acylglycerol lipase